MLILLDKSNTTTSSTATTSSTTTAPIVIDSTSPLINTIRASSNTTTTSNINTFSNFIGPTKKENNTTTNSATVTLNNNTVSSRQQQSKSALAITTSATPRSTHIDYKPAPQQPPNYNRPKLLELPLIKNNSAGVDGGLRTSSSSIANSNHHQKGSPSLLLTSDINSITDETASLTGIQVHNSHLFLANHRAFQSNPMASISLTNPNTTITAAISNSNNCSTNSSSNRILAFYDFSDQELISADAKYKSYALAIDKALKSFEYTSEWADLVSALGKLNRVLSNNNRFHKIPRRFIVGQRLAQCMHPLLPSGVHLKALETYNLIFNSLGEEQLLADLTIYSNGLFPLLGYAAINVRPTVLDLYERHLLPLGDRLKLALDGFLIGLLPCYEEGSDTFNRTDRLLQQVSTRVGVGYFYSALWRCVMQNSSIRLPAITFVLIHFNKKRPLTEQAHILGLCMRTLVRAICAALLDSHILVQRAVLDLLINIFPLHLNLMTEMEQAMAVNMPPQQQLNGVNNNLRSPTKSQVTLSTLQQQIHRKHFKRSELIVIITAALTVLLRRDLSLNRRLNAWFFGSDSSSSSSSSSTINANSNLSSSAATKSSNVSLNSTTVIASISSSKEGLNSSDAKIRRKKTIYFETYARDLVVEAFKRCITNPLSAITSILPQTAITNSFISFTLPFPAATLATRTATQNASMQSSPSTSTSSLMHLHLPHLSQSYGHRRQSSHGSISNRMSYMTSNNSGLETYSSSSTFWPYRLLICILDQRDIATPILETLCIDILRGLYHEFEMLTCVVPPPTNVEKNDSTKKHGSSDGINQRADDPFVSQSEFSTFGQKNFSSLYSTGSSSEDGEASTDIEMVIDYENKTNHKSIANKQPAVRLNSKSSIGSSSSRSIIKQKFSKRSLKKRGKVASRRHRTSLKRKTSSGSKGSTSRNKSKTVESNPVDPADQKFFENDYHVKDDDDDEDEDEDEDESSRQQEESDFSDDEKDGIKASDKEKTKLKASSKIEKNFHSNKVGKSAEDVSLNAKRNLNLALFDQLKKNVKNKSATMMRKLQFPIPSSKISDESCETQPVAKPTKVKGKATFQFRNLRLKINKSDEKQKLKDVQSNGFLSGAESPSQDLSSASIDFIDSKAALSHTEPDRSGRNSYVDVGANDFDDDESVFVLPHQHYYWNPYYQQSDKYQRRELLKELDRVMHLLFTHVGVDFIWSKLTDIFELATQETNQLKKLIHSIIKKAKHNSLDDIFKFLASHTDFEESDFYFNNDHHPDDDDQLEEEENENEIDYFSDQDDETNTTVSHSSSGLNWARNIAFSLLSGLAKQSITSSSNSSASSTPYASPRISSPNQCSEEKGFKIASDIAETSINSNQVLVSSLKNRLLAILTHRCRQCGRKLAFNSPVQPVGTDSVSVLEACTLARFILGDSRPYGNLVQSINLDDELYNVDTSSSSFLTNSVSVSLNRCSALEPLSVDTNNYLSLIHFFHQTLVLMSRGVKSFTSIDLRASIELCLALCAKLKPAIMQTFVNRYRSTRQKIKSETLVATAVHRKPSLTQTSQWSSIGVANYQPQKVRSSSSSSSKKHLELVREEDELDEENSNGKHSTSNTNVIKQPDDDGDDQSSLETYEEELKKTEVGDDYQIELVIDGVLEFFAHFVESILVKSSSDFFHKFYQSILVDMSSGVSFFLNTKNIQSTLPSSYHRYAQINQRLFQLESGKSSITIRHHLLPIYQLLCELMVEVSTIPLLTSPMLMLKKRRALITSNSSQLVNCFQQPNDEPINKNKLWFVYLLVLSTFRLSSCSSSQHHQQASKSMRVCCQLRQIAYTSLSTVLDLITLTRGYIVDGVSGTSPLSMNWTPTSTSSTVRESTLHEFQMPNFMEMIDNDLFPGTFVAKRLNFFPLINPEMLHEIYHQTLWFKLVTLRLWSNLSINDSQLHHATTALLQQLNSVALDSSVCESVICDEMMPSNISATDSKSFGSLSTVYEARRKFCLMFAVIRDIRFVSERLALIVNSLSALAKTDSELDGGSLDFSGSMHSTDLDLTSKLRIQSSGTSNKSSAQPNNGTDQQPVENGKFVLNSATTLSSASNNANATVNSLSIIANSNDLQKVLNLSCPVSPLALCTSLKRHFDRPLLIMLDALSHRRLLSDHHVAAADWFFQCISPVDLFGTRNLMFTTSPHYNNQSNHFNNSTSAAVAASSSSKDFILNNSGNSSSTNPSDSFNFGFGSQNDVGRLLEPLMLILLNPNASRLSVKNVNIRRFNRSFDPSISLKANMKKMTSNLNANPLNQKNYVDDSKIYAINSTNGHVIYHVRRMPPSKSSSGSFANVDHSDASADHSPAFYNFSSTPNEKSNSKNVEENGDDCGSNLKKVTQSGEMKSLIEELVTTVTNDAGFHPPNTKSTSEFNHSRQAIGDRFDRPSFPGTALFSGLSPSPSTHNNQANSATDETTNSTDLNSSNSSGIQLKISYLHSHMLFYEREYDSTRTIYALDTILTMIETWPTRMIYAMASTTLSNSSNSHTSFSSFGFPFDGTRAEQIKTLFLRHNSSIAGRGFYQLDRSCSKSKFTCLTDLRNITYLELIITICLQYLRSYYPSCSVNSDSTMTKEMIDPSSIYSESHSSSTDFSCSTFTMIDSLLLNLSKSNNCIDFDAIHGNQRVRLLSCELLRLIFHHLLTMIDVPGKESKREQKRHQTDSLLQLTQSKSFIYFLKDILFRCEIQRNVLQCLVTSVWHYQKVDNESSSKSVKSNDPTNVEKNSDGMKKTKVNNGSYLYPHIEPNHEVDPEANIFIKEILDYNDYPGKSLFTASHTTLFPNEQSDGFHDEFEKCLLRLIEQLTMLEVRITHAIDRSESAERIMYRASLKDLHEMRFDTDVPLVGQPLLIGAIFYALQQNHRRHIHSSWLLFVETLLQYSGRYMSKLVLVVIGQLCRNLDTCSQEINEILIGGSCFNRSVDQSSFTYKHFLTTLHGVMMIYSYCLLDRTQCEKLMSFLSEINEDTEEDYNRAFGLFSIRKKKRSGRFYSDSSDMDLLAASGSATSVTSAGTIQLISSLFQNIVTIPNISTSNSVTANTSGNVSAVNATQVSLDLIDSIPQKESFLRNLLSTRSQVLEHTMLNRVLTSLFNVWRIIVDLEETEDDFGSREKFRSFNPCCHRYLRFQNSSTSLAAPYQQNSMSDHCSQSNCSLGWSTSVYTGWHIMGSSFMVRSSILSILSVVAVSDGVALLKSVAHVWHNLRERSFSDSNKPETLAAEAIDVVIPPVTEAQRKLVQLLASLNNKLNLESLIQIVRNILKPSSSTTGVEVETTQLEFTSNPFDNIFLMEISILEIFLIYLRTCSGDLLLNSCRSMLSLIRDGLALNLTLNVPCKTFLPRNSLQPQQYIPTRSVSINFQPLVNIHLLAIMHEFVIAAPFVEERRAQKELQEVAQKLIDNNVTVAGGRLLHSRFWSFRRNLEVIPVGNSDAASVNSVRTGSMTSGTATSHTASSSRVSSSAEPTPILHSKSPSSAAAAAAAAAAANTEDSLSTTHEQQHAIKRGLFRLSASVSLNEKRFSSEASNTIFDSGFGSSTTHTSNSSSNQMSDGLLFGLFNFNMPSLASSGSGSSSSHNDLASTSQNLFYSFFCIKALYALAEFAAPILDVVYASEEKEKMIPLITNLMSYVIPYLKSHSQHNLPCFDACTRLLASLSGYQYTRKAWRKESLELLLEPSFFQMLPECLPAWRTIIDHLMTHDKNTFREFLGRMSVAQSPSVSLKMFVPSSGKDQEAEPRAQLVKRLAFILFCSEKDQYQKYMAEIQEKLIEIHRQSTQSQSPATNAQLLVQAQVLLAFRVIILRMSPHHLASLWPFIYTEMFQVFLLIEQVLIKIIREEQRCFSENNSESNASSDALHPSQPRSGRLEPKLSSAQLQLFLNACKLLDLALLLPSDTLPQFQMHKWAFISDTVNNVQWIDIPSLFVSNSSSTIYGGEAQRFGGQSDTISTLSGGEHEQTFSSLQSTSVGVGDGHQFGDSSSLSSSILDSGSAPQSLPVNLNNTSQRFAAEKDASFIPHIVFINSLLNYVTDRLPQVSHYSTMAPLLDMSSIESIHDLHFFFTSLLYRSHQSATLLELNTLTTTNNTNSCFTPTTSNIDHHHLEQRRQRRLHRKRNSNKQQANSFDNNSKKTLRHLVNPKTLFSLSSNGDRSLYRIDSFSQHIQQQQKDQENNNFSLDELFMNIDRIIATDFLEPMPPSLIE